MICINPFESLCNSFDLEIKFNTCVETHTTESMFGHTVLPASTATHFVSTFLAVKTGRPIIRANLM